MAKVSVVVPLYNVEAYVGECIASLKRQTMQDFQVVCIDDGSPDASLDVARRAAGADARFTFVSQSNQGLSAARNNALSHATGEYVLFLDGDDMLDDRALEVLTERADRDELDDLFFSAQVFYDKEQSSYRFQEDYVSRKDIDGVFSGQQLLVRFIEGASFNSSAAMQLLRRDFLERNELAFYEGILHEDNLFTVQVLAVAGRAGFLNEPLYMRRIRAGSIMTERKTVRHLYGNFVGGWEVEKWLCENWDACEPGFGAAATEAAAIYYTAAAENAVPFDEAELERFADTLPGDQNCAFRLRVIEVARNIRLYKESTSFRVGSALLALPRAIKDGLRWMRLRRGRKR